ncbi:MAG TPA: hypothetical protein VFD67_14900 [Gemmatimonadaceae bacterium]|nr:hypothetical protein [Gemmatimonadaceae bacterium]
MPTAVERVDAHSFDTFVRAAVKFKPFPSTKELIETIMPYYPKQCICIAGYLDDEDQFWKVNFHWELLVRMLNKGLTRLQGSEAAQTRVILNEMLRNPPSPTTGYADSKVVGQPHDTSSHQQIVTRWRTMKVCKEEFRLIVDAANLTRLMPPSTPWDLSVAPVAHPGTSKHGTGYAVDIQGYGLNHRIKEISTALGATLAFDEKSHVHVEFAKGVKIPGRAD